MTTHETLTPFEQAAINELLSQEPAASGLWRQAFSLRVRSRESTGSGFYTHFEIPEGILPLSSGARKFLRNVGAHISGLKNPVGFILLIQDGVITMLEGFSYGEPWPKSIMGYEFFRYTENRPD